MAPSYDGNGVHAARSERRRDAARHADADEQSPATECSNFSACPSHDVAKCSTRL